MTKTQKFLSRSALSTGVIGLALVASPAFAQEAAATDESETIVVTGTLIANPNLESSSPVAVVGQEEIQLRQSNSAEALLREVPGITPNLGGNVNNGTVGAARVDLRNLGANRNIVLLDSQRLVPASFFGSVDLNNIPLALVERVDVLTGGASTTYGADAVSGVVNFITKRDFAGFDATISNRISEEGDAQGWRADVTIGANFDDGRGNAVISVGYMQTDPLYFGSRGFGTKTVSSATGVASGDSFTSVPAAFSFGSGDFQLSPDSQSLVPFYNAFNFNPYNVYTVPFERFNMYASGRYEVSDTIEVYARGLFSKNTIRSVIAPSGIFGNALTIPGQNPYLTPAIRNQLCTINGIALGAACDNNAAIPLGGVYRRTVELGPRISEYVTNVFDYTAGARFNITDSIKLDVYGAYGESENTETRTGYVANSRVQQALNATNVDSCLDTSNSCVPLNLFGQAGSISQAMGGFIGGITSSITNKASLAQAHALLSGDFGATSPWAEDPISFAVGGEYRDYTAERRPDNLAQVPGELGGAGGATLPLSGGYHVYEAFAEVIAPIVADKPGFHSLTLEAGVRYSDYTVDAPNKPTFNATTYKFGATWEPVEAVALRGNYQRAVRAPNIGELFAPVVTGLTNLLVDPCAGAAPTTNPNLEAVCLAQGAPQSSIGNIQNPSAGQANATGGGDPNIRPEKATTYSLGFLVKPQGLINGLQFSVDYYNIKVKNAITNATPDDVISACFDNITAASATDPACTGIRRNALNGRLSGTSTAANPILGLPTPLTNDGRLETDGIDLKINYRTDLSFAQLILDFQGNYTFNSKFQASPTSVNRECVGYYSTNCGYRGSLIPEFSWNQRTTLSFEDVDVSLLWRHLDGMKYEPGLPPLFEGTITGSGPLVGKDVNFNKIKSYDYFDLTTRFDLTDNFDLTVTIYNMFDKKPPIVGSSAGSTSYNSGNTYPSTYDTIGRSFGVSGHFKF